MSAPTRERVAEIVRDTYGDDSENSKSTGVADRIMALFPEAEGAEPVVMDGPCFDPCCPCCVAHAALERKYEDEIEGLRAALEEIEREQGWESEGYSICDSCRSDKRSPHDSDCVYEIARRALSPTEEQEG